MEQVSQRDVEQRWAMAEQILYLTELLGLKIYDLKRRAIGRVRDAAIVPLVHPVRVDRYFLGGGGWSWMTIRFDQVASISLDGIYLSDEQLVPYHADEYLLRLERDLLDQQIIDAQGRKVVRVNDVTFGVGNEEGRNVLLVQEVDIGVRSIFRRLGQGILSRRMIRRFQRRIPPHSIPWDLCNIVESDPQRRLRLNISVKPLEDMHPADLADIVEELSPEHRSAIFEAIDPEAAAEALSEVEPDIQARIVESLETETAADILEEMDPDEAADVLAELEQETSEEILEEMETEPKADVQELMEYEEDTAGGLMTTDYVALHENATVADALQALRGNEELLDTLNTLFLIDKDERLTGVLPLARVFLASPDGRLKPMVLEEIISVPASEKADRVTEIFDKYNILTLPVIDDEGKLAGVVTADDIISVLRRE
jgi:magnesium transporter